MDILQVASLNCMQFAVVNIMPILLGIFSSEDLHIFLNNELHCIIYTDKPIFCLLVAAEFHADFVAFG